MRFSAWSEDNRGAGFENFFDALDLADAIHLMHLAADLGCQTASS